VTDVLRGYAVLPYLVGGILVVLLMILGTLANILYALHQLRDGQWEARLDSARRPDTDPGGTSSSASS